MKCDEGCMSLNNSDVDGFHYSLNGFCILQRDPHMGISIFKYLSLKNANHIQNQIRLSVLLMLILFGYKGMSDTNRGSANDHITPDCNSGYKFNISLGHRFRE